MMARHPAAILEDYRRGDRLNDEDLAALREDMEEIDELVGKYGDMFELTSAYARSVAWQCRQHQRSRRERALAK